ncbi:MAG: hypothetical protein ACRECH_08340 [Nitrososphaerales archaeon]
MTKTLAESREKNRSISNLLSIKSVTSTTALLIYLGAADFVAHMLFAGD